MHHCIAAAVCSRPNCPLWSSLNVSSSFPLPDVIKLQLVEAGLVECLLEVVAQTVDGEREEDIAQLKTASDLMVLLLLGGKHQRACPIHWLSVNS